jgi:hypothetical protein
MKVAHLGNGDDPSAAIEITCATVSFGGLLRALRRLPDCSVSSAKHDLLTDDASAEIMYKDHKMNLMTPFSDFVIERPHDCPDSVFREIVAHLERAQVRWWEHML